MKLNRILIGIIVLLSAHVLCRAGQIWIERCNFWGKELPLLAALYKHYFVYAIMPYLVAVAVLVFKKGWLSKLLVYHAYVLFCAICMLQMFFRLS